MLPLLHLDIDEFILDPKSSHPSAPRPSERAMEYLSNEFGENFLRRYEDDIKERGFAKHTALIWEDQDNVRTYRFRPLDSVWHRLDGSVAFSAKDEAARYSTFTLCKPKTSNTIDIWLFVGIQLQAARRQVDMITVPEIQAIGKTASMVRLALRSLWGLQSEYCRDHLRDTIRTLMLSEHGDFFSKNKPFHVLNAFLAMFKRLPQMTFTTHQATKCCKYIRLLDNPGLRPSADPNAIIRYHNHVQVWVRTPSNPHAQNSESIAEPHKTLQHAVDEFLSWKPIEGDPRHEAFCNEKTCTKAPATGIVIRDRLPPILIMFLPNPVSIDEAVKLQCFREIVVEALREDNPKEKKVYTLIGCIGEVPSTNRTYVARYLHPAHGLLEYNARKRTPDHIMRESGSQVVPWDRKWPCRKRVDIHVLVWRMEDDK